MNFSIRISKIFESRVIYELLKEDNPAVYLLFVLCNRLALDGAINHGKEFLEDLKNGKLPEIPDYNVKQVTKHENYTRTGKMEYDMTLMAKDNEKIGELLYKLFKDVWDLTTKDLYFDNDGKLLVLIDQIKSIDSAIQDAPASLYENNLPNIMKRIDWTEVEEEYQKEKKRNCVTMDWLQEKQEDVLKDALELDIMHHADEPSTQYIESVDYDYHRSFLPHSYTPPTFYKEAYAKIMKLAKRVKGLFIPNLGEYGKHFAPIFYKFRPEQKHAIFKVIKKMELIHKDMVKENEELGQYINIENEETNCDDKNFAFKKNMKELLYKQWFSKVKTDKRYDKKWIDAFVEDLMNSEWHHIIEEEWQKSDKRLSLKANIIGCLKVAGVIDGSNLSIASAIVKDSDIDIKTFASYIGRGAKRPFCEWIVEYPKFD
ncbi:MAG: hypothetical protein J6X07_01510 [Prevotella sp.]|nr:hypothetical protein [Prevotella sp.]